MCKITYGKGEEKCNNCGQFIRNIAWVDGVPFGLDCARKFLPKSDRRKSFDVLATAAAHEAKVAERRAILQYALTAPTSFANQTTEYYVDYVTRYPNGRYVLQMLAYLALRQMDKLK